MGGKQGTRLTMEEIVRVQHLLAETELAPQAIAYRMGVSPSTILSINRRSRIRHYNGRRSRWEKGAITEALV
jgi:hypothetical protein